MARSVTTGGGRRPMSLTLPFSAQSAGVARHEIDGWLTAIGTSGEIADDARLVVSELVGNAVRHAQPLDGGTMEVAWVSDPQGLDIAVTDGGSRSRPRLVEAGLTDVTGRGLAIVDALASRWWIESMRCRTTVHAILALA